MERRTFIHSQAGLDRIDINGVTGTLSLVHFGYYYELSKYDLKTSRVGVIIYRSVNGLSSKSEFIAEATLEHKNDGLTLTLKNLEEIYVWNLPAFEAWYLRTWITKHTGAEG